MWRHFRFLGTVVEGILYQQEFIFTYVSKLYHLRPEQVHPGHEFNDLVMRFNRRLYGIQL